MGCHVGLTYYAGAFGYADDIALVAPSLSSLKQMIKSCEQFAESHSITFNPSKTKLLCFNMKLESKVWLRPLASQYLLLVLCNVQAYIKMLLRVTC